MWKLQEKQLYGNLEIPEILWAALFLAALFYRTTVNRGDPILLVEVLGWCHRAICRCWVLPLWTIGQPTEGNRAAHKGIIGQPNRGPKCI